MFNVSSPRTFRALGVCALLWPLAAAPAWAQVDFDPEGVEEAGVPHIVIGADGGTVVIQEFDAVDPTPTSTLSGLFPQFASVLTDDIPTLVVAVGAQLDAGGNPVAVGTEFPGDPTQFEFLSAPVSALDSGFLNDDNGFESAGSEDGAPEIPTGANINLNLSTVDGVENSPFFIALGTVLFTNIPEDLTINSITGGFDVLEDGETVSIVDGSVLPGNDFALGDEFDIHPLFGLTFADAATVGAALIEVEVTDAGGELTGSDAFRFLITNDPAAFVIPEPTAAGLLAGGGLLALRRRRWA